MPTIAALLTQAPNNWTQGAGPNFYFPGNEYPHLHLIVANAQNIVNDLPDIRPSIVYFGLTFGGQGANKNIDLMAENVTAIGNAIRNIWGGDALIRVQYFINRISGRGVDT